MPIPPTATPAGITLHQLTSGDWEATCGRCVSRSIPMTAADGREGRLLRVPPSEDYAELLRKDLWTVGARAARLHTEDATRTKMTGHCLRDTGLTHMAVRGDSPIVIQWCGGHTDFKMTQGYIDRGRVEARRIGEPLPPLPPEVLDGPQRGLDREAWQDPKSRPQTCGNS